MFEQFKSIDKMALIAAVIHVTHADEELAEEEVGHIQKLMEAEGLEDFEEMLHYYEELVQTRDDYIDLLKRVYQEDIRKTILQECMAAMGADEEHHDAEVAAIRDICAAWGMDAEQVLKGQG